MYTTVEGLLEKIIDNVKNLPFTHGDSSSENESNQVDFFCDKIISVK
jgi:hypothetical protein